MHTFWNWQLGEISDLLQIHENWAALGSGILMR